MRILYELYARNGFIKDVRVDRIGIRNKLLLRRHPRRHLRHVFLDIVQVFMAVPFPQYPLLYQTFFVYWKHISTVNNMNVLQNVLNDIFLFTNYQHIIHYAR